MHEALARVLSEPSFARAAQQKSKLMQAHSRSPRQRTAGDSNSALPDLNKHVEVIVCLTMPESACLLSTPCSKPCTQGLKRG